MIDYNEIRMHMDKVHASSVQYIQEKMAAHGPYVLPECIFGGFQHELYDVDITTRHENVWATIRGITFVSSDKHPHFTLHAVGNEEFNNESYNNVTVYSDVSSLHAISHFINWWEEQKMDTALELLKHIMKEYKETDDEDEQAIDILQESVYGWFQEHGADDYFEPDLDYMCDLIDE